MTSSQFDLETYLREKVEAVPGSGVIRLKNARHPLLDIRRAILEQTKSPLSDKALVTVYVRGSIFPYRFKFSENNHAYRFALHLLATLAQAQDSHAAPPEIKDAGYGKAQIYPYWQKIRWTFS